MIVNRVTIVKPLRFCYDTGDPRPAAGRNADPQVKQEVSHRSGGFETAESASVAAVGRIDPVENVHGRPFSMNHKLRLV